MDGLGVQFRKSEAGRRQRRSEWELARLRAETGMVFQLFYLFPHLTALQNVMLGLRKVRKMEMAEVKAVATD